MGNGKPYTEYSLSLYTSQFILFGRCLVCPFSGDGKMEKVWYSYDDIHRVLRGLAEKIQQGGVKYDAMVAIGGGGFIPARILRCFLNIPIYAVTTAYYQSESCGQTAEVVSKVQ